MSDDFGLIQLFSKKPTFHALSLFTRPWTEAIYGIQPDELRPTLALSYQFDSLWGAATPFGYHLGSIALHALNGLLVLAIARRIAGLTLPAAAFAAMLFSVLPIHAEAVAWISGRADSLPALFYLLAFLSYASSKVQSPKSKVQGPGSKVVAPGRWTLDVGRWTSSRLLYLVSLGAFFLALFSKQSAITMLATLIMFDLLVARERLTRSWAWVRDYAPFAFLTVSYLALRFLLFGNAVREQQVSMATLVEFLGRQSSYLKTLILGAPMIGSDRVPAELGLLGQIATWTLIGVVLAFVLTELRRPSGHRGVLLFFGPVWWMISIVPLAVTYEAPRHLYLASVGIVVAVGVVFDALWTDARPLRRMAGLVGATALVLTSTYTVDRLVSDWNASADVSARISQDAQREIGSAPPGSLVIVGTPVVGSSRTHHTWLWMWALPFALEPPFVPAGLAERVALVEPPDVYCCLREQWELKTRQTIAGWASRPAAPVIVLSWDTASGALARRLDRDEPQLRQQALDLLQASSPKEMCERLDAVLGTIGNSCATS